jgi:hypothetical protein
MPTTYDPIATSTVAIATTDITFSSIASSWTDLRVVLTGTTVAGSPSPLIQFNSDTGANYSYTRLTGNGTSAASVTSAFVGGIRCSLLTGFNSSIPSLAIFDIFSYTGSTIKTVLVVSENDRNGTGSTERLVGLWNSTSAITTVNLSNPSLFAIGTTATLYGIKNA